jgi:hypothetical protein
VLQNPFAIGVIWTPSAVATLGVLDGLPNFFADLALLCRMLVVYPYSTTGRLRYFAIFVPVVCIKILRIVSMAVTISLALHQAAHVGSFAWTNANRIWVIVNVSSAALDNWYVYDSAARPLLILCQLRERFLPMETPRDGVVQEEPGALDSQSQQ